MHLGPRGATLAAVLVSTAAVAPVMSHQLAPGVSFVAAVLALVACFDILSIGLLAGIFRDTGDRRVLALTLAYAWSLVVMSAYGSAFPGVMGAQPPLMTWSSVAPYLWAVWHGGFPLLLGLAYAPWPARWQRPCPPARRTRHLCLGLVAAVGLAALPVAVVVQGSSWLPSVISGLDTTAMTRVCGPWMALGLAIGLVLVVRGLRGRTGPERWVLVACVAVACDVVLTLASHHRYSAGWYAGRTLTVVSAGAVLWAMLAEFTAVRRRLLVENRTDPLTGLANRPAVLDLLDAAITTRRPTAVMLLDLDGFKQVNDTYGHAMGDAVLVTAGSRLQRALSLAGRSGTAARLGGDEFVLVFDGHDRAADSQAARAVVDALAEPYPGLGALRPSASAGLTWLSGAQSLPGHLLHEADAALYLAKSAGGNQLVEHGAAGTGSGAVPRQRRAVRDRSTTTQPSPEA